MASTKQAKGDWFIKASRQVSALAADWDGYGSPAPRPHTIRLATDLLSALQTEIFPPAPHICPVTGGGIGITWQLATRRLEVEILPDGSLEYVALNTGGGETSQLTDEGGLPAEHLTEARPVLGPLLP